MTMREEMIRGIQAGERSTDTLLSDLVDCVWTNLEEANEACARAWNALNAKPGDERRDHLQLMLNNALSDVVASFMSLRQGFLRPPGAIQRVALETLACVVTFHANEEAYKAYEADKYQIQKAIGPAKKFFPMIGHLYGIGSGFVHEPHAMAGRALLHPGGRGIPMLVPPIEEPNLHLNKILLLNCANIAGLVGQVAEWAYGDVLDSFLYWTPVPGTMELKGPRRTHGALKILALTEALSKDPPNAQEG